MEIKTVDIEKLRLFEGNPKVHPKSQIDKIVRSFSEFGWTNPCLVTKDNMVVGGYARVEAAKKAGIKQVPVIFLPFDGKKALAYMIADNKLAELADWDFTKLGDLMTELDDGDFGLELTGFDMSEIEAIMDQTPKEEEPFDAAAEAEKIKEPKAKRGEIYQLGRHRLMCGDAMKREDVEGLMDGKKADMVFTDPPYGIDLIHGEIGKVGGGTKEYPTTVFRTIHNDNKPFEPLVLLALAHDIVIWGGNYFADKLPPARCWFIWDKKHPVKRTFCGCELAWTNLDRHAKIYASAWDGWTKEGESDSKMHPSQKPVKLCADILMDISSIDALILDLFGGSGSTLIACEQTNRICYMMEIDPIYIDVIINRFEKYANQKAELISQ